MISKHQDTMASAMFSYIPLYSCQSRNKISYFLLVFVIYEVLYTWCLRHNICSAWFLDIRISLLQQLITTSFLKFTIFELFLYVYFYGLHSFKSIMSNYSCALLWLCMNDHIWKGAVWHRAIVEALSINLPLTAWVLWFSMEMFSDHIPSCGRSLFKVVTY